MQQKVDIGSTLFIIAIFLIGISFVINFYFNPVDPKPHSPL